MLFISNLTVHKVQLISCTKVLLKQFICVQYRQKIADTLSAAVLR